MDRVADVANVHSRAHGDRDIVDQLIGVPAQGAQALQVSLNWLLRAG
ncbi:MAG: hypothetical protein WBD55_02775 [Dehalococcoidia bacterium]